MYLGGKEPIKEIGTVKYPPAGCVLRGLHGLPFPVDIFIAGLFTANLKLLYISYSVSIVSRIDLFNDVVSSSEASIDALR
jgi:hypothetical protein